MTAIQEKLIELLEELDRKCSELKFPYIVSAKSLIEVLYNKEFRRGTFDFQLLMKAGDMVKLKEAIEEEGKLGRAVEDLSVNSNMCYPQMRYVNTDTTFVFRDYQTAYNYKGIAVTIQPMYTRTGKLDSHDDERYLYFMNSGGFYNLPNKSRKRKLILSKEKIRYSIFGKDEFAMKIYKRMEKDPGNGKTLYVWKSIRQMKELDLYADNNTYQWKKNYELVPLKAEYINKTKKVDFEGISVSVPVNSEKYLKSFYGDDFELMKSKKQVTANGSRFIVDSSVPYKEFERLCIEEGIDFVALDNELQEFHRWRTAMLPALEKAANDNFKFVEMTKERIEIWERYANKREKLQAAYDDDDVEKLEELMSEYLECVDAYYKRKMGFYLNETYHKYAEKVFCKQGRPEYTEQVKAMVPQAYIDKDIDAFMKEEMAKK